MKLRGDSPRMMRGESIGEEENWTEIMDCRQVDCINDRDPAPDAHQPTLSVGTRWLRFSAGLSAILLFAFVVVPAAQQWGPVKDVRMAVQRSGIDATALIYTECEVSSDAEFSLLNSMRYASTAANHEADADDNDDE